MVFFSQRNREGGSHMKHKNIKRITGLLLALALAAASFSGCSGKGGGNGADSAGNTVDGANGESAGGDSGERAMGRFLEEEVDTGVVFGNIYDMKRLEDGTIRLIGADADNGSKGAWDSKDGGASWEQAYEFPKEIEDSGDGYSDYVVLSQDGQAACAYNRIGGDAITTELYLLDKDGKARKIPYELPKSEEHGDVANLMMGICFLGNEQILVQDISDIVYQVNTADGSVKHTYEFDGSGGTHQIYTAGSQMVVVTETEVLLYNTESGEQLPAEETLQKCVTESGFIHAVDTTDAGESMYYLTSAGLYHYKFGGSLMEQMIDGEMNSLGAPAFYPIALAVLDEQNILVAANDENASSAMGISLLKFAYSAETPAKPDKELKVYSLYENRDLGQAISRFRKEHTDIYVNYQVAMSEENGMTLSDALKTLTTEIMAGKGPDVLVLDGMPVETYVEKGILKDISALLAGSEGNYFEDIIHAYQDKQGQICAVPARFKIPMIQAGSAWYTPGENFDSFTGKKDALAKLDAGAVIEKFWYTCGAAWRKDDGTLDETKITEFLTKLKNAYGEYDSSVEDNVHTSMGYAEEGANPRLEQIQKTSFSYGQFDLAFGRANVSIGLAGDFEYGMMNAVNEKLTDGDYGLMPGQAEHVFVPEMTLGISSKSAEPETAEEFVKFLLSPEGQKINQSGGFPVEKEVFTSCVDGHKYTEQSSMVMSAGAGISEDESLSYEMEPTPQDAIDKITNLAESLTTPAFRDDVIKETVAEQGMKVLKGEIQPQEATNAIMQAVNIYLAE